jgi:replicative DNA helicase
MQSKLTLRLEEELVRRAKRLAKKKGKSVSKIVADYFTLFEAQKKKPEEKFSPIVQSLKGALRGTTVDVQAYRKHLEEKYLK